SPRPNERLRMISARRAREADLDKVFSLGFARAQSIGGRAHMPERKSTVNRPMCHRPQKRTIQYSEGPVVRPRRFGVLDTALSRGTTKNDNRTNRTTHLEHAERPQDQRRAG